MANPKNGTKEMFAPLANVKLRDKVEELMNSTGSLHKGTQQITRGNNICSTTLDKALMRKIEITYYQPKDRQMSRWVSRWVGGSVRGMSEGASE